MKQYRLSRDGTGVVALGLAMMLLVAVAVDARADSCGTRFPAQGAQGGGYAGGGAAPFEPGPTCVRVVAEAPIINGGSYFLPLSTPDPLSPAHVYAFAIDVYISPAFLRLVEVSRVGTMTEGNGLFAWREVSSGLTRITWAGVDPLVGPGVFAYLNLELAEDAPCASCTVLDVGNVLLNEGEPCALAVDGQFCTPNVPLQGRVTFFACDALDDSPINPRPLAGVHLLRTRDCGGGVVDSMEAVADGDGDYSLDGCPECQSCLTSSHARSVGNPAISSWDASLILRYVLQLNPLNLCIRNAAVYDPSGLGGQAVCPPPPGFEAGFEPGAGYPGNPADYRILPQKVVADVSRNHSVTAYDAALILKYIVGDPLGIASRAGEWDFYCAQRCYEPAVPIATADFVGLLNGDVSGSWQPDGFRSVVSGLPILVSETFQPVGDHLWQAAISVANTDGFVSGDFQLSVEESDWDLVRVRAAGSAANCLVEGRLELGALRVALAGAEPVADGTVVLITLRSRTETIGSVPALLWAEINDGSRPVELHQPTSVPAVDAGFPAGVEFRIEPNPSRQQIRLTFRVPETGPCLLEIFAPDGRVVARLTEGVRAAGRHTVLWDGHGDQGQVSPSGVYFARLRLGELRVEQRLVILR